jgi:hypothetical protein
LFGRAAVTVSALPHQTTIGQAFIRLPIAIIVNPITDLLCHWQRLALASAPFKTRTVCRTKLRTRLADAFPPCIGRSAVTSTGSLFVMAIFYSASLVHLTIAIIILLVPAHLARTDATGLLHR